jgi:TusE/DsrC/DsvC family sulfur relay protein
MRVFQYKNKTYEVDEGGFLLKPDDWDAGFAKGMAAELGISRGLTDEHWRIISFIRDRYMKTGECPLVYEIGTGCGVKLGQLKRLFPTGYLRGACVLAGLTYREDRVHSSWLPARRLARVATPLAERVYRVNYRGFLIDPSEWDEEYAVFKAAEMGMPELTEDHWHVIGFLRESFGRTGRIPTVYETCEARGIDLDEFGKLFSAGYHRGAVKIAGLKER